MERDHRHLDRERQGEREEHPELEVAREAPGVREQLGEREGAVPGVSAREVDGERRDMVIDDLATIKELPQ